MKTTEKSINQIITALFGLEAKKCYRTYFEYGNGLFQIKIFKHETEKVVYEKTINVAEERKELKKVLRHIIAMRFGVMKFHYQCYKQKFVKGITCGEWEKTNFIIKYGKKATAEKSENGLFINDFENDLLYFVDFREKIEMGK